MVAIREIEERPAAAAPCARLLRIADEDAGLEAYLALDGRGLAPAYGGIRRRIYRDRDEALREVLALARGMGRKIAFAGLEAGGAKAVILDREGSDRGALYEALGRALVELEGLWVAGPDLGTGEADLDLLRARSRFVNARGNDPGRATARGVFRALEAGLEELDPEARLRGLAVLVQGLGSVGRELAWMLLDAGAAVTVADLEGARAEAFVAAEAERGRGARIVPADAIGSFAGEIFCPCAAAHVIDRAFAERAGPRLVCGSANEQLADPALAELIARQGRLLIPDFAANAGAVIEGVVIHEEGEAGRPRAERLIEATRDRVRGLLRRAAEQGKSPLACALAELGEETP